MSGTGGNTGASSRSGSGSSSDGAIAGGTGTAGAASTTAAGSTSSAQAATFTFGFAGAAANGGAATATFGSSTPAARPKPQGLAADTPEFGESDEARYSRHLDVLLQFYAKHDPTKTREQVVAIIGKRKGDAVAMPESLFVEVCGKLENKYGENPLVLVAPAPSRPSASAVDPEMAELLQDDIEDEEGQQDHRQSQKDGSETSAEDTSTLPVEATPISVAAGNDVNAHTDSVGGPLGSTSVSDTSANVGATDEATCAKLPSQAPTAVEPTASPDVVDTTRRSDEMVVEAASSLHPSSAELATSSHATTDPPPESDEARYSRHLDVLLQFYARHDPTKTREQVVAIIDKRKGDAVAMPESLFVEVCGKLENKYGENPLVSVARATNEARTDKALDENMDVDESSHSDTLRSACDGANASPTTGASTVMPVTADTSAARVGTVHPQGDTPCANDARAQTSIHSLVDTEHDLHRVEQQLYRCKTENEKLVRLCSEQKRQLEDNEKQLALCSKTVAEEQRSANSAKVATDEVFAQKETLSVENAQLRKALDEKTMAIQARDKELEEFTARVVRTNALKAQAQDDHHEAVMKLQRARRDMSVAEEEAELARQQARSSDSEVRRLNEEVLNIRKEKSARERELQEEVNKLRSQGDHQRSKVDGAVETDERVKLQVRVSELEAEAIKAKADAEEELRSQQKLTQLYKEAQEDSDLKAAELQVMLAAKTDEYEQLKREHAEERSANETRMARLEEQERAATQEVQALKQRLEEIREFGDGAFLPPVMDESGRKRRYDVSGLSESAALAQRYANVSSTVLASRYEKSQVELRKAKEECTALQASLDNVLTELEQRAPTVAKVFEEQEIMSKKYSELSAKLSEAAEQNGGLRKQLREANNFRTEAQQHREVLEREVVALRKQVGQLMSVPVQTGNKRRRGSRAQLTDRPQYRAAGTTMALPAPANAAASTALVLQDVDGSELNAKQDLERKVIELQVQCETLREASSESTLQTKLKESVAELEDVREQRRQMEEIIESITKQRDAYMETLKSEIEGNNAKITTAPQPDSPRKLPPPPSAELQCMQTLASLQADYAKSRTRWSERVDELQNRVDGLSKRASDAEIAYAQQKAELEQAKLIAADHETQEKDMERRLQLAQERATESDVLLRELRSKLDTADADRSLAKAELARVASSLDSAERRYEASKSRESAVQTQYEEQVKAKNAQSIALADALEARQRDSQAHSQEVSTLQLKLDEIQEEKKNIERKFETQQDALEANRAALSSVSKARDSAEELVLSLRASQEGLRAQCTQLSTKLSEAKAAAATASSSQNAQRASSLGLTAENAVDLDVANLRAELASSAEQITSLKQHITDYKQLVQHSENQVKELQQAAEQQTASHASSTQQLSEVEVRCKSLAAELDQATQKAASSAAALQAKEAEVATEQAAKGAAERRAGQLQAQLSAKTAELDKATTTVTELKIANEAANAEVAKLQALAKQVEAARAEAITAQGALSRTEAKGHEAVNAMEKKLDTAAAEMRDLRTQNEMLLGQLDRAMSSLATDTWSGGGGGGTKGSEMEAAGTTGANANTEEDINAVVEGLREVVKSLRRGREMAEARLELVQQQAVRDKSQVQVLQRELAALRQQGSTLAATVESSPRGAQWTEKERAELVGSMAAAQETATMVEELRAARNHLASQLQTANQAKNAAISAKALAEKEKEQAELASSRLQAQLSVKETEVKMWQTKLEKSTERTKIQQLMKDKKEALATAKEAATKLENEKKIVKQWIAKHAAKDREASTHKVEAIKQKSEVTKLQSQVTELQTEKIAAVKSASEKDNQLAAKSDEEAKTKADLAKTKKLCTQLLEKVRSQTCPKCGGSSKAALASTSAAATTAPPATATSSAASATGPDKPFTKAATPSKTATASTSASAAKSVVDSTAAPPATATAKSSAKSSPTLGAASSTGKPTVGTAGGAIAKGPGRGGAARGVKHNRGGGRGAARGAVLHNRGAKAPLATKQASKPAATSTVATTSASATASGGLAAAPSLSAPATASSSAGIGSGIGSGIGGKLSATAPTFTFGQSSTSGGAAFGLGAGSGSSGSSGSSFVFGKPPSSAGTTPTFSFGQPK